MRGRWSTEKPREPPARSALLAGFVGTAPAGAPFRARVGARGEVYSAAAAAWPEWPRPHHGGKERRHQDGHAACDPHHGSGGWRSSPHARPHTGQRSRRGALADLGAALDAARADDGVRAVVLTGAGAFFSAGVDLAVIDRAAGVGAIAELFRALRWALVALLGFPRPTVCMVKGHALGGGLVLAIACDYRLGLDGGWKLGLDEVPSGHPIRSRPRSVAPAVAARPGRRARPGGRALPGETARRDLVSPRQSTTTRQEGHVRRHFLRRDPNGRSIETRRW